MPEIQSDIHQLAGISLEEMDRVALLNRTDTKFVFSMVQLRKLLQVMRNEYRILDVNQVRIGNYRTLYFDTPGYELYNAHHRGLERRFKIRMREYTDSRLHFLEIKFKNKGRTDKKRKKIISLHETMNEEDVAYVKSLTGKPLDLVPSLWNAFQRMTLVSNRYPERVTIDLNLSFKLPDSASAYTSFPNLVIAEVKQDNRCRTTLFMQTLKSMGIRECGMSKYCIGMAMLNPLVKYNGFKDRILLVQKMNKAA